MQILFLILALVLLLILLIVLNSRTRRLKNIAKEFDLVYEKPSFLDSLFGHGMARALSGNVNGHRIEITDILYTKFSVIFGTGQHYRTIFKIDGVRNEPLGYASSRYAGVRLIRSWLKDIDKN
ncbi:MAG: hypothetical protein ACD_81C00208G0001 [uncultured bacterium]|uniref:Uncharacterized protein n=1 Tax=Candidatus Wolfebacteria bacterium GW2011_GWC2_39_22 TaxID=1619013 RepID=A0A0G0NIP9_9BACT|nr:MAG: hypothetical protein ACD_81C00208G0001 [uncultured bacterium]KKR12681.1 MAG: hypothetical protein UT41_C0001G0225 [Candidatus Wolfebacteria bacterium GW2011_GWC2_39_22]HBI25655.1 hypothetical protein [Candidatus Wolfebacteria bacterium]